MREGLRATVQLPPGFFVGFGYGAWAHPCGAVVMTMEPSPLLTPVEAVGMLGGAEDGIRQSFAESGFVCGAPESGLTRCQRLGDATTLALVARRLSGGTGVLVLVQGRLNSATALAIAESVGVDPSRTYDPIRASDIQLSPPAGMELVRTSIPGNFAFTSAGATRPERAEIAWRYFLNDHPWSDEEIGRAAAELAVEALELTSLDAERIQVAGDDSGGVATMPAMRQTIASQLSAHWRRTGAGVWITVTVAPTTAMPTWSPVFEAHLESFRPLEQR